MVLPVVILSTNNHNDIMTIIGFSVCINDWAVEEKSPFSFEQPHNFEAQISLNIALFFSFLLDFDRKP